MLNREEILKISPKALFDEPMSNHTSFKIGGSADAFVSVESKDEIKALIAYCKENDVPYLIMGNGSNMLVGDGGIRGVVIQIGSGMQHCEADGEMVYAEAGVLMSKLANVILRAELTGFETLCGIPGTLGGGIYMNAGAYGGEIKDVVTEVTYLTSDGEFVTAKNADLDFAYRHSIFCDKNYVILSALLKLTKGNYDEIKASMSDYNKRRNDKQPINMPSAGSTFKRPDGYFAGKLIQDCGLMGYTIGGAQVSEKHAGFIVNIGGATAADILALIQHVQAVVKRETGVDLEPEVKIMGEG